MDQHRIPGKIRQLSQHHAPSLRSMYRRPAGAGKSTPVCGDEGSPFNTLLRPKFLPFVAPVMGTRNRPLHSFSGVTVAKISRNRLPSACARANCSGFGSTNCGATFNFSTAKWPSVTVRVTLHVNASPSAVLPATTKSCGPVASARSMPSKARRTSNSLASPRFPGARIAIRCHSICPKFPPISSRYALRRAASSPDRDSSQ